jgi:energy-coupling factor transporter transmembrane protein EcfT
MLRVTNVVGPCSFGIFMMLAVLKVCEKIPWDWFWIASPLWITFFSLFILVYVTLKNRKPV